jgi:hypothetical protein
VCGDIVRGKDFALTWNKKLIIKTSFQVHYMRKEFVIKRIDASPDGVPYVIVSLTSSKDLQEGIKPQSQFDPSKMMDPAKMQDMVKDLNMMLSGAGGMMPGGGTSLKLDMHEYKEMNLSVGDKVYLDLTKDENTGV